MANIFQCYNSKFDDLRRVIDERTGITLITDFYTDFMQNHYMNFVIKVPTIRKTYFYKLIDTNAIDQNSQSLAKIIKEIGVEKVNFLITDNAKSMKLAGKMLCEKFEKLHLIGCSGHVLNLLIKDIACEFYETTYKLADKICSFFHNHRVARNLLNCSVNPRCKTRWYSMNETYGKLLESKQNIVDVVTLNITLLERIQPINTSKEVCEAALNESFWNELQQLVDDIKAPSLSIGQIEGDNDPLFNVYLHFGRIFNSSRDIIKNKTRKRLGYIYNDVIGLSFLLLITDNANVMKVAYKLLSKIFRKHLFSVIQGIMGKIYNLKS